MEWFEQGDRQALSRTAAKYAAWLRDNCADPPQRAGPEEFDLEMVRQAGRAGLLGAPLAQELGGAGIDALGRVMVMEGIGQGRAGAGLVVAVHWAALCGLSVLMDNSEVRDLLAGVSKAAESARPLLCGVAVPAMAVEKGRPEPVLAGAKGEEALYGEFICPVHPCLCERVVLFARDAEDKPGLLCLAGAQLAEQARPTFPGSGAFEVPMAGLELDGFEAGPGVLARGEVAGAAQGEAQRELYLGLAAAMVGNAAASLARAQRYSGERVQTGRLIAEHQEVRRLLEQMEVTVEAARAMVFSAAAVSGDPAEALRRSRRSFLFAGGAGEAVCLDAVQVLGGYGYMEDYGLERRLRDLKTLQCILGGHFQDWIGGA